MRGETVTNLDEIEKITEEDREHVRSELSKLAEWLRNHYPNVTIKTVNQFLHEMVDVSV